MKLEEELRLYKESRSIQAREICRKRTIEQSKKVFYAEEQKRILSGTEFLYTQLGYIRKRWWMLQALLLISLWSFSFLYNSSRSTYSEVWEWRGLCL